MGMMHDIGWVPLILGLLAFVVVWALVASSRKRRALPGDSPRACIGCGTVHPGHAAYCRHCGRKLA